MCRADDITSPHLIWQLLCWGLRSGWEQDTLCFGRQSFWKSHLDDIAKPIRMVLSDPSGWNFANMLGCVCPLLQKGRDSRCGMTVAVRVTRSAHLLVGFRII
jgi:hypothetical protein